MLGWARRQYTGSASKITNCQIGVFAVYVSDKGLRPHRLSSVSSPRIGLTHQNAKPQLHVPDSIRFVTKPLIAAEMIEGHLRPLCRSPQWLPTQSMVQQN